jgi:hypothetical protein
LLEGNDVLTQGRDYLLFEKVECSQQSLITVMTRDAVVITQNLIAIIPVESDASVLLATESTQSDGDATQSDGDSTQSGGDALRFVKALLADPAVDVCTLENALRSMFAGSSSRWVFPIGQAEKLKVTTGFFGNISLKMPRDSMRRFVIRDKGGKGAAAQFLAQRSAIPQPVHLLEQPRHA